MFLAKKHNRSPYRGPISPWLRYGPLLFLLMFSSGYSPVANAAFDAESCLQVQDELKMQLSRKFKRADKSGLADRRKKINDLAGSVSSHCAWMLLYKINQSTKHRDAELRELISGKLAAPARRQFVDILVGQTCCDDDDLEQWGRSFDTDAERGAYVTDYFDELLSLIHI